VYKLSIIIPVLGRPEQLESTLVSVLQNRPDDAEVIVVFNRPYDDPYDLAGEVRLLEARRRAGLVECLDLAIAESQAPIVHWIACGVEAVEGWADSPLRHLRDPHVAAVTPLLLTADEPRRLVAAGISYSRGGRVRLVGQGRPEGSLGPWTRQVIGPSLLAGFYRKSALQAVGGLDRALSQVADADLALRLRASGQRVVLDPQSKMHVTEQCQLAACGLRYGLHAERLFLRHVARRKWSTALLAHTWTVAVESLAALLRPAALTQLMGRALAWTSFSQQRRQHEQMLKLAESLPPSSSVPRPHLPTLSKIRRTAA
jgi:hypothetical protein